MKEEIVNKRMSELLLNDDFNLSIGYLCKLHKNLFKNVYVDCGIIRSYNVRKREMSLNGETIDYADNHGIITLLNMIFDREKVINYKSLNEEEIVENQYKIIYLTARSMTQHDKTMHYLYSIKQDNDPKNKRSFSPRLLFFVPTLSERTHAVLRPEGAKCGVAIFLCTLFSRFQLLFSF